MKIAKDFNVYFQSQDPLHNEIFALDLTILNCETIPFGGLPNYFFHNFSNNLSIGRNYLPYWIASIEVKVDIKKNPQIDTFLVKEQLIYQVQGKDLRLIEAKDKKQAIDNGSLSPLFLTPSAFLRGQGEIDFLVHSSTFELTYDLFSKKILDQVLNKLENL